MANSCDAIETCSENLYIEGDSWNIVNSTGSLSCCYAVRGVPDIFVTRKLVLAYVGSRQGTSIKVSNLN